MTTSRLSFLVLILLLVAGCARSVTSDQVCFDEKCVEVELAITQPEHAQGLMNREFMPANSGMLFIFSAERPYSFWMKNTLISLDIIWLDYSRRIVHIEEHVPPCKEDPCPSYQPESNALYVLEVNGGKTKEWGINVGDQAVFRLPTLNES